MVRKEDDVPITIVAEAGINHGGSLKLALALADAAKESSADAVKYQVYIPDRVLRRSDPDYDVLARHALSFDDTLKVAEHCRAIGIEFFATPGDLESLRFLVRDCHVRRIKIGSDDLTNRALVAAAYNTGLPVILSTGMATDDEVDEALPIFRVDVDAFDDLDVTLLHCVSLYPCPLADANLRRMVRLRKFGWPVGYSDHCEDVSVAIYAAAAGATMIEKHIALTDGTIDDAVSVLPIEFKAMVGAIREVEAALGDGFESADHVNRARFRKAEDGLRGLA